MPLRRKTQSLLPPRIDTNSIALPINRRRLIALDLLHGRQRPIAPWTAAWCRAPILYTQRTPYRPCKEVNQLITNYGLAILMFTPRTAGDMYLAKPPCHCLKGSPNKNYAPESRASISAAVAAICDRRIFPVEAGVSPANLYRRQLTFELNVIERASHTYARFVENMGINHPRKKRSRDLITRLHSRGSPRIGFFFE